MSGIDEAAVVAVAILHCNKCGERWESQQYVPTRFDSKVRACAPAWERGWRVYAGGRSQHTYCGGCAPTVPMHLVYGPERAS